MALSRAVAGVEVLALELEHQPELPPSELPRVLLEYLQQLSGAVRRTDTKRISEITQQRLDYLLAGLGIELEDFRPDEDQVNPYWEQRPDPAIDRWLTLLPLLRYGPITIPGVVLKPHTRL